MTDARGNTEYYHYDTLFSSETEYVTMTGDRIRYEYDAGGRLMTMEDAFLVRLHMGMITMDIKY